MDFQLVRRESSGRSKRSSVSYNALSTMTYVLGNLFKSPFPFQLISFSQKEYFEILAFIYYNKCILWRFVEFERLNTTTLVFLLSNCLQLPKILLNIYAFCIWLLGCRIEFSCLYIQQGQYYFVAMKYRWICIFYIFWVNFY